MNVTHWIITKTMPLMVTVPLTVTVTEVLLQFISCITVSQVRHFMFH